MPGGLVDWRQRPISLSKGILNGDAVCIESRRTGQEMLEAVDRVACGAALRCGACWRRHSCLRSLVLPGIAHTHQALLTKRR